jgi:hypothetical protein
MKKGKPRGPVPSLIGSTLGTPRRVPVERTSECTRCSVAIAAGRDCVAIPKLGGSFSSLKRYCDDCFKAILEKTEVDLDGLVQL